MMLYYQPLAPDRIRPIGFQVNFNHFHPRHLCIISTQFVSEYLTHLFSTLDVTIAL